MVLANMPLGVDARYRNEAMLPRTGKERAARAGEPPSVWSSWCAVLTFANAFRHLGMGLGSINKLGQSADMSGSSEAGWHGDRPNGDQMRQEH